MDWENLLGQHKVAKGQIFMMTLQKDKSNLDRSFSSLNVRSLFSILELTFLSTSQKVSMSMEYSGILSKKNIQFIYYVRFIRENFGILKLPVSSFMMRHVKHIRLNLQKMRPLSLFLAVSRKMQKRDPLNKAT